MTFIVPVPPFNAGESASLDDAVALDYSRRGLVTYSGSPAATPTSSAAVESSEGVAVAQDAASGTPPADTETTGGLPV